MRILFAWELGANYGHLARTLPLALRLREEGCDIHFTVADTAIADKVLKPKKISYEESFVHMVGEASAAPISFAQIIECLDVISKETLIALIERYREMFIRNRTDIIIGDFSPIAAIAAMACGLKHYALGDGYTIPPYLHPLPSMRPWDKIDSQSLIDVSDRVLRIINEALLHYGKNGLFSISEIFPKDTTCLLTYRELDHYKNRIVGRYVGVMCQPPENIGIYDKKIKPRIFAYIRKKNYVTEIVRNALLKQDRTSLCIIPGYEGEDVPSLHFNLSRNVVSLDRYLETVRVMITHGNAGTVTAGLLRGIPQIIIPTTIESRMFALRVAEMGAGIVLNGLLVSDDVNAAINVLMTNTTYRHAAEAFAFKYSTPTLLRLGYDPLALTDIVKSILGSNATFETKKESQI